MQILFVFPRHRWNLKIQWNPAIRPPCFIFDNINPRIRKTTQDVETAWVEWRRRKPEYPAGENHRSQVEIDWKLMISSRKTLVVEVGGMIYDHYASLTPPFIRPPRYYDHFLWPKQKPTHFLNWKPDVNPTTPL